MKVNVAAKTDKGLVRPGNEDYLHVDEKHCVFAVCDGMGGHQAGEVASMTTSETIRSIFSRYQKQILNDAQLSIGRTLSANGELLLKAIRLANRAVNKKSAQSEELAGMGTTVVAVALEADIMSIAHVGDSRAYRLNERELEPLTRDHSWVAEIQEAQNLTAEEANSVIGKNVITRAIGVRDAVEVDFRIIKVKPGDIFILCSDGLCGFADDDEIYDVATRFRSDITKMTDNLVQMANDRGGSDNVSVVVIEVTEVTESPLPDVDVFTLPAESPTLLEIEDNWLDRIAEDDAQLEEQEKSTSGRPMNHLFLFCLFALFAIVAVLIIWMRNS